MRTVVALVVVTAVACSSAVPKVPRAPDEVTGLITSISRGDRGSITGFTVEARGRRYRIRIDPEREYGFDLEHLEIHRAQRLPVRVTLEERSGALYAVEILDA